MTKATPKELKNFKIVLNNSLTDIRDMIALCKIDPSKFPVAVFGGLKAAEQEIIETIKLIAEA